MAGLAAWTLQAHGAAAADGRWAAAGAGRSRLALPLLFLVLHLGVPGALACAGVLDSYAPVPRPLLVVFAVTIATLAVGFSSIDARIASGIGLGTLVGFQAFRIPVEILLHRLYVEGVIPEVMTYSGRNFDIVTGLSGAALGLWLMRGTAPRALVLAWNVVGLLLLANIVSIAVLAAPTPLQVFTEGPSNRLPGVFPFVWLPTVLVQLALIGHVLVFRRMQSSPS
jgi:hypothetical protein